MKEVIQIAKVAEDSNKALLECAAICQKAIFSYNKQSVKPASYYVAVRIQKIARNQINENNAVLK